MPLCLYVFAPLRLFNSVALYLCMAAALRLYPSTSLYLSTSVMLSLCIAVPRFGLLPSAALPGIPGRIGQRASSALGRVRLVIGRRMIHANALHNSLLEPIFLAHTALNEHALDQTPLAPHLKPQLDPTMILTMPHLTRSDSRYQKAAKPLLAGLLGAWLTTHTLSALGDSEGASEKILTRVSRTHRP